MIIKKSGNLKYLVLFLLLVVVSVSCSKSNKEKSLNNKKVIAKQVVKKVKKNPKKLLESMKIDRAKAPFAGVWEPSTKDSGFLLMFPDGKFELYGRYDRKCHRHPKKKGTYKVKGNRNIEFTINGKTENKKLNVMSGFVKIKDFGLFLIPNDITLKEENEEYTDPKKLIEFCRNVNAKTISKIYPYLTQKSKLALIKIGILDKDYLASHEKYTRDISDFLKKYKKIVSINSIKKEGNSEIFKLILRDMDGASYSEKFTITKENDKLRCGFFDNLKLRSSRKNTKEIAFWFKDLVNSKKGFKFHSKRSATNIVKVRFDANNITIQEFKAGKVPVFELKGDFKIIANTPNVVALFVKNDKKNDKQNKKEDKNIESVNKKALEKDIVVFKFGSDENIDIILKDKTYLIMR